MKCFDCPYKDVNPYPSGDTSVAQARFETSLVLFRPKEGITGANGDSPRDGEDIYLAGATLVVSWHDAQGQTAKVTVPPGFVTDLTSVPALLRSLVSRAGPWLEAAVVHDYLYVAWQGIRGRKPTSADRLFADRIMLAAMTAADVSKLRRTLIYLAVRLAGGRSFFKRDAFRFGDGTDLRLVHLSAINEPNPPTS